MMFFGIINSPATFQTMMNNIFWNLIAEGIVVIYLDDILIFTKTEEEHAQAVQRMLQVLQEKKLFLCLEFLVTHALEEVELTGIEQKILSDICKGNRNGDQEEPIAEAARELRGSANRTVHSLEWLNIDGLLWFQEKIYVPQSLDLCR